jgi:hypothetical protein
MSTSKKRAFAMSPPSGVFLRLVETAASDIRLDAISAQEKPVTKLTYRASCEYVWKAYKTIYQDHVEPRTL